jgi:23S rRNA A2030 N6-methylase RlmJ
MHVLQDHNVAMGYPILRHQTQIAYMKNLNVRKMMNLNANFQFMRSSKKIYATSLILIQNAFKLNSLIQLLTNPSNVPKELELESNKKYAYYLRIVNTDLQMEIVPRFHVQKTCTMKKTNALVNLLKS